MRCNTLHHPFTQGVRYPKQSQANPHSVLAQPWQCIIGLLHTNTRCKAMAVMQPTNQSDLLNRSSYLTTQCTNGILHNQVAHMQIEAVATTNHMYMLLHAACTQQERLASTVDGRTGAQVPTVLETPSRLGCSELMLRLYSLLRLSLLFTS